MRARRGQARVTLRKPQPAEQPPSLSDQSRAVYRTLLKAGESFLEAGVSPEGVAGGMASALAQVFAQLDPELTSACLAKIPEMVAAHRARAGTPAPAPAPAPARTRARPPAREAMP